MKARISDFIYDDSISRKIPLFWYDVFLPSRDFLLKDLQKSRAN